MAFEETKTDEKNNNAEPQQPATAATKLREKQKKWNKHDEERNG